MSPRPLLRRRIRIAAALLALSAGAGVGAWFAARRAGAAAETSAERAARPRVDDFRLLDQDGLPRQLRFNSDVKAVVIVAQQNGCWITRKQAPVLRELARRYGPRGVVFWMINASPADGRESIAAEAREYGLAFPILRDEAQLILPSLGLTRAPEAVLIDTSDWGIAYRGEIDDRFGLGVEKPAPTRVPLADAIEAVLAGRSPAVARTEAAGCLINIRPSEPSYSRDVAPVLRARCLGCHGSGGAPPTLDGHASVESWAPMIRESIRTRRMPPWPPDAPRGAIEGELAMSPDERRAVVRWIEQGARRWPGEKDPLRDAAAASTDAWPLGPPDLVWEMKADHRLEASDPLISPLKYVALEPPVPRDLWLRAIDLRPRNRAVKQHINLLALPEPLEPFFAKHKRRRYGQEMLDTMLWDLFLTVRGPEERRPPSLPSDTAYFVPKGSHLVLEFHYQSPPKPESDRVRVGLYEYRGSAPPRRLRHRLIGVGDSLRIPAGAKDHRLETRIDFGRAIDIVGVYPHMHLRGVWMKFLAKPPGAREEEIISFPDFNFFWASWYRLARPRRLPAGAELVMRAGYDNSPGNPANPDPRRTLGFGWTLLDEMFGARVFYTEPPFSASR